MDLVYDVMKQKRKGEPSFSVPKMRYVNVVLAVANNSSRDTYLLEEVVGEEDGAFRKYINNTSAVPLTQTDEERQHISNFLSFSQHVQILETQHQVFVSDQQGIVVAFSYGIFD